MLLKTLLKIAYCDDFHNIASFELFQSSKRRILRSRFFISFYFVLFHAISLKYLTSFSSEEESSRVAACACGICGKLHGFLTIWLKQLRRNVTFTKHYRVKSMFGIRHMIMVCTLNHYFSKNILPATSIRPPV